MYAVIFRAKIDKIDKQYTQIAERMRQLAFEKYGCIEFTSVTENNEEISISYWKTQEQIKNWKEDAEHIVAQEFGKTKWYKSYKVQVIEILREYKVNT